LKYQQNPEKSNVKIIILLAFNNKISTLIPFVEKIEKRLSSSTKQRIIEITV